MATDEPRYPPPGPENRAFVPPFGQPPTYGLTQPQVISEHRHDPRPLPYLVSLLDISTQEKAYVTSTLLPPTAPGWQNGNLVHQPTQGSYGEAFDMDPQESLPSSLAPPSQHEGSSLLPQV